MHAQTIDMIDIGVNLTHDSYERDRDEVIARAADAGVRRLIVTGTTLQASRAAVELARRHPGRLFATAGIHPHHAQELGPDTADALAGLAADPEVVALGECGLDYFRNFSPREAQLTAFETQLEVAARSQLPVFLHQREAHDDFVALLRAYLQDIPGGVAHCFTDGPAQLREYLDLGLHIGITGWICDERRADALRDAVRFLPLDRVLLETDAPYLVPRDLPQAPRGRRNEPCYLPQVLRRTAGFMNCPPEELAAAATRNSERLFRLDKLSQAPRIN